MEIHKLTSPLREDQITRLRTKDLVYISGRAYEINTVHQYNRILEMTNQNQQSLQKLNNAIICHTYSSVNREDKRLNYFGFITSYTLDRIMPDFLKALKSRAIIGKAGMGDGVIDAMKEVKCVYLAGINGCSAYYTLRVASINIVYEDLIPGGLLEYNFESLGPLVVTIDTSGCSLHKEIEREKNKILKEIIGN